MPTRREDRERRRAERLAAERAQQSAERRRLIIGYMVAGVLGTAVLAGIVIAIAGSGNGNGTDPGDIPDAAHVQIDSGTIDDVPLWDQDGTPPPEIQQGDLETAARQANCDLQLELEDEGNTHVRDNTVNYKTNPPTSGNHNPNPQADGAYTEMPDQVHSVHSLEHGRILIQYSPELPEDEVLELKGVFDESPDGVLFFPNPDMPYEVAVTAWRQLMGCDRYEGAATLDAIRDFRDIYLGNGPEQIVPISLD
jgi:hypothetical protein